MVLKKNRDTLLSFSLKPGAHNALLLTHVIENHLPLAYPWTTTLSNHHCDVRLCFFDQYQLQFFSTHNRLPSLRSKRLKKTHREKDTWKNAKLLLVQLAWLLFLYDNQDLVGFHNFAIELPIALSFTIWLKESWFANLLALYEISSTSAFSANPSVSKFLFAQLDPNKSNWDCSSLMRFMRLS